MTRRKESEVRQLIGNPKTVAENLKAYRASAKVLSSEQADLIAKYPKRWVAVHKGKVVADAPSLDELLSETDGLKLSREQILVRFIERTTRKLIL